MLNGSSRSNRIIPFPFPLPSFKHFFFPVNRFILVLTLANTYIRVILFSCPVRTIDTQKNIFHASIMNFEFLCCSLDSSLFLIYRHVCKCILTSLYSAIITLFIYIEFSDHPCHKEFIFLR